LGTIGHLVGLRRLGVAPFAHSPQWTFETLEALSPGERARLLLPVDAALGCWRRLDVPPEGIDAVRQGRSVTVDGECTGNVRIYAPGLGFVGLGWVEASGRLKPLRLISAAANRA
jgi:tRNA U55 pseudouridine synthase TruB